MTHLLLIRHGQTDWNIEGRWQGHADVPLNIRGYRQAKEIARRFSGSGLSAIYSSDLERARATAEALSKTTGLPVQLDPRLREIHQGEWQGLLVDEIEERYGDAFHRRRDDPYSVAPPGGETVMQVMNRVVQAIEEIIKLHPDQRVAVVSHGFSLALVQVHYLSLPIEHAWSMIQENEEVRELTV